MFPPPKGRQVMARDVEVVFFIGAAVVLVTLILTFLPFSICFFLSVIPKPEQYNLLSNITHTNHIGAYPQPQLAIPPNFLSQIIIK